MTLALVTEVRQALAEHADPAKAEDMKRYMKSEMPYRGVQTPLLRRMCKDVFRRHSIQEKEDWQPQSWICGETPPIARSVTR